MTFRGGRGYSFQSFGLSAWPLPAQFAEDSVMVADASGREWNPMEKDKFDSELLTPEELCAKTHFPTSLFRLAVDCGCPNTGGRMRFGDFAEWNVDNYSVLRARAGLPELPGVDGLPEGVASYIAIGNSMLTILDYMKSRTSDEGLKNASADVAKTVLQIMDSPRATDD